MDEAEQFFTALQLGDSFFPSGAFAYSSGLETFVSEGLVTGREHLVEFVGSYLAGLYSRGDLIHVRLSHRAAAQGRMEEIVRLDGLAHAMKLAKGAGRSKHADGKAVPECGERHLSRFNGALSA